MAADLTEPAPKPLVEPYQAPVRKRYGLRFLLVYGALAGVLAGSIAGLVLLLDKPGAKPSATWSAWQPVGSDPALVTDQIAQHVGGEYRFTDGKAVVGVQAAAPTVLTLPVGAVELRGQASVKGSIVVHRADHAWQYQLCGGGNACSIARGKPSKSRGELVRREALELALYTFKFVPEVDSVIALLPPAPPITSTTPHYLLYLRRSELGTQLSTPLATFLPKTPPLKIKAQPIDTGAVDDLALSKLYKYQPQQLQDGTVVLVLDPVA